LLLTGSSFSAYRATLTFGSRRQKGFSYDDVFLRSRGSRLLEKALHLFAMIRCTQKREEPDPRIQLRNAIWSGVVALSDVRVEARVVEYFEKNPDLSRDAVHVAAMACRVREELVVEGEQVQNEERSYSL
jgi:hypothetical protein